MAMNFLAKAKLSSTPTAPAAAANGEPAKPKSGGFGAKFGKPSSQPAGGSQPASSPASEVQTTPSKPSYLAKFGIGSASKAAVAGASTASKPTMSFMKRGKVVQEMLAHEQAQADLRREQRGGMFRFRMPVGETRHIIFLDGNLDGDGLLENDTYYEHTVKMGTDFQNYVCCESNDPPDFCPICAKGEDKPYIATAMTCIDLTPHKIKSGKNAGKIIENSRKLFIPKRETHNKLQKIAEKRGGLVGCLFEVSRSSDTSAAVGDQFDFEKKFGSLEEIAAALGLKLEECMPADYSKEIVYRGPDELVALGVGKGLTGPGTEGKGVDTKALAGKL